MMIDTNSMVSMTEANQNFSKVARLVDEKGSAVIMKHNTPKYLVLEWNAEAIPEFETDEMVEAISKKLMKANRAAYEVLAK